jgi:hypothetical protein
LNEIVDRNNYLWENRLTRKIVNDWLENFSGQAKPKAIEEEVATKILNNFIYYGEKELRYLCKAAFSLLKRQKIAENPALYMGSKSNAIVKQYLDSCYFSYIGRAGESGGMVTYYFRQENDLSIDRFAEPSEFTTNSVRKEELLDSTIVFIDDFLGTGRTACDFWRSKVIPIKSNHPKARFQYLALVATTRGIEKIAEYTGIDVICPEILDDSYRAFYEESLIFPVKNERDIAREVCEFYGGCLVAKAHALGYRDSQAILGFHHNIPDNTLPIIWAENKQANGKKWRPLFKRKHKK